MKIQGGKCYCTCLEKKFLAHSW